MGRYIHPASTVENEGLPIAVPNSWAEARAELRSGEHLSAVATRGFGKVALLVNDQIDFDHVRKVGCDGLYIIDSDLAAKAT